MFLWISGFLKGDDDDSLKYELTIPSEHEEAVIEVLGWANIGESPDGEFLLNREQVHQIAEAINESLPSELDLFIGVRA